MNAIGDTSIDLAISDINNDDDNLVEDYYQSDIFYEELDDKFIYYEYDPIDKVFR